MFLVLLIKIPVQYKSKPLSLHSFYLLALLSLKIFNYLATLMAYQISKKNYKNLNRILHAT